MTHNQLKNTNLFAWLLSGTFLSNPIVRAIRGFYGNDGLVVCMQLFDTFRSQSYCLERSKLLVDIIAIETMVDSKRINAVIDLLITYGVFDQKKAAAGKLTSLDIQDLWFKKIVRKKPSADMPDLLILSVDKGEASNVAAVEAECESEIPEEKEVPVVETAAAEEGAAVAAEKVTDAPIEECGSQLAEVAQTKQMTTPQIPKRHKEPCYPDLHYPERKRSGKTSKVGAHKPQHIKPKRITIRRFLR